MKTTLLLLSIIATALYIGADQYEKAHKASQKARIARQAALAEVMQ